MHSRICKLHLVVSVSVAITNRSAIPGGVDGESDDSVWCSKSFSLLAFKPYPASVLHVKMRLTSLTLLQLMIYALLYALFKAIRRKLNGDWGFVKLEPNLVTLEYTLNYMRHKVRPHAKEYKGLWAALKEVWLDGFVSGNEDYAREADEHNIDEEIEPENTH